ncbi:MAG: hypothetical protein U0075_14845 [Thermomicrobiales bacterium]
MTRLVGPNAAGARKKRKKSHCTSDQCDYVTCLTYMQTEVFF